MARRRGADVQRARLMSGEPLVAPRCRRVAAACPESPWWHRVAAAMPPRCRYVAATGRGGIAVSRRGVAGEGRTLLLRRNVLCSIHILENKFYLFYFLKFVFKSVRPQGGREEERARTEGKGTGTKEHRPSAVGPRCDAPKPQFGKPEPRCGARGRCRLQGVYAGRHGEMRFLYDRRTVRESVDTGRHA